MVKEARQQDVKYHDKMNVFDKQLAKTSKTPLKARLARHRQGHTIPQKGCQAVQGLRRGWSAATPPVERLRIKVAGRSQKWLTACDCESSSFYAPVLHDMYFEGEHLSMQLEQSMSGTSPRLKLITRKKDHEQTGPQSPRS